MATCDNKETCTIATNECDKLSRPFMESSKTCYTPGKAQPLGAAEFAGSAINEKITSLIDDISSPFCEEMKQGLYQKDINGVTVEIQIVVTRNEEDFLL